MLLSWPKSLGEEMTTTGDDADETVVMQLQALPRLHRHCFNVARLYSVQDYRYKHKRSTPADFTFTHERDMSVPRSSDEGDRPKQGTVIETPARAEISTASRLGVDAASSGSTTGSGEKAGKEAPTTKSAGGDKAGSVEKAKASAPSFEMRCGGCNRRLKPGDDCYIVKIDEEDYETSLCGSCREPLHLPDQAYCSRRCWNRHSIWRIHHGCEMSFEDECNNCGRKQFGDIFVEIIYTVPDNADGLHI